MQGLNCLFSFNGPIVSVEWITVSGWLSVLMHLLLWHVKIKWDYYAQARTIDSHINNKWPAQINNVHKMPCHCLGHSGQKLEICGLFKAEGKDCSVFDEGQWENREQRRSRGILHHQRITFQCVSCHLIIHPPPPKIGLHLWMKKIPLCIQHCYSVWQYGGSPSVSPSPSLPMSHFTRWPSLLSSLLCCQVERNTLLSEWRWMSVGVCDCVCVSLCVCVVGMGTVSTYVSAYYNVAIIFLTSLLGCQWDKVDWDLIERVKWRGEERRRRW